MPAFGPDQISDAELDSLVVYLKELRRAGTAARNLTSSPQADRSQQTGAHAHLGSVDQRTSRARRR
jgi:hypothetical protein